MVIQPVFARYWKMPLQPSFPDAFFPTLFSRNRAAITQVDRLSQTLHYLTHLNQHFSNHWSFDSFVPYTLLAPFDATLAYLGQEKWLSMQTYFCRTQAAFLDSRGSKWHRRWPESRQRAVIDVVHFIWTALNDEEICKFGR